MTILESPYLLVTLKEHICTWPWEDFQMPATANQQHAFYMRGKKSHAV